MEYTREALIEELRRSGKGTDRVLFRINTYGPRLIVTEQDTEDVEIERIDNNVGFLQIVIRR